MTPTPVRRPTRALADTLGTALSRPAGPTLVAGGLLLGLGAAAPFVHASASPAPAPASHAAPAASAAAPLAGLPRDEAAHRVARASRGGVRTALPPATRLVTRTVPVGQSFSGLASWYGGSFVGQRTANGERFDTEALTAASRTLPFGTRLRVCRHRRCVVVRVNDRGPYVDGRVLDLSSAARRALGYDGVARVTATPVAERTVRVPVAPSRRRAVPHRVVRPAVVSPVPARPAQVVPVTQADDARGSLPVGSGAVAGLLAGGGALGVAAARRRTALGARLALRPAVRS